MGGMTQLVRHPCQALAFLFDYLKDPFGEPAQGSSKHNLESCSVWCKLVRMVQFLNA
jgi:hypothetical protein